MNNIILCQINPHCPISGNLFYLFEYFLLLKQHMDDVHFVLIDNQNIEYFYDVMDDRYNIDVDYKNNVVELTTDELSKLKLNRCLTTDRIYNELKESLFVNDLLIFQTWESLNNKKLATWLNNEENVTIYNECEAAGTVNYYRKMLLNQLRMTQDSTTIDNNIFLHMPFQRQLDNAGFMNIYKQLPKHDKLLVYSLNDSVFNNPKINIEFHATHIFNFFDKFTKYAYVLPFGMDYSPRLLIECKYLGKEILYYREKIVAPDGGTKRYNDILNNNIDKYQLTIDDEIIQRFLND